MNNAHPVNATAKPADKQTSKPTPEAGLESHPGRIEATANRASDQKETAQPLKSPTLSCSTPAAIAPDQTQGQPQIGLLLTLLENVQLGLGISLTELAVLLGRSKSTIYRYKQADKPIHQPAIVHQLSLLQALIAHGKPLFKTADGFHRWLRMPQWDLTGSPPLLVLSTSQGISLVDQILGRIEHGLPI